MLLCRYCNNERKNENSLRNHERLCKNNPSRQCSPFENSEIQSKIDRQNQYTKAKELGIEAYGKQSAEAKEKISKLNKDRGQSIEAKAKLSKIAKERGLGGHISKQQIFFEKKNGEVVYLQSSYEIKFASILEELQIEWTRPSPLVWIDSNGEDHKYYPDFKIGNKFFDTKNDYLAIKDADKIERVSKQNNVVVEIITYDKINKDYIKYALLV